MIFAVGWVLSELNAGNSRFLTAWKKGGFGMTEGLVLRDWQWSFELRKCSIEF